MQAIHPPEQAAADDREPEFRAAMRRVAAPVAVVTTLAGGRPRGSTVSAFDSLSLRPALMTVALQESSSLLAVLRPGAVIGINVLASDQAGVAEQFAAPLKNRFDGVDWHLDGGAPRLRRTHAWFALRLRDRAPGGDHVVLVCDVEAAAAGSGLPLVHHDGSFGTFAQP